MVLGWLVVVPAGCLLVARWVVAPLASVAFDGPLLSLPGPHSVEVATTPDGVAVIDAPCRERIPYRWITVRAVGGTVVWQAEGAGASVPRLTVGTTPAGFRDVVPLAAPLDPHATYVIELTVLRPGTAGAELLGAGTATFRPGELPPEPAAGEFERVACAPPEA